jgi:sugar transferase (PEP-CTERM/EpsH1 system associated)
MESGFWGLGWKSLNFAATLDSCTAMSQLPVHVTHVIHQLATGGMENGLVNLINNIDPSHIKHSVLCMTNATDFRSRIKQDNIAIAEIGKREKGNDFSAQWRAWKQLCAWKPDVLHSRNLTGLDAIIPAFFAGVPARIHGEHGRDMTDPDGTNKKFILLKKLHAPFIHQWSAVSQDLANSLTEKVGIPPSKISRICNGVDLSRFERMPTRREIPNFSVSGQVVFGTVGRLQDVKEQWLLLEALALLPSLSQNAAKARVLIVGDGPMRARLEKEIAERKFSQKVLLAGAQNNVPDWLQSMDVFCLPSRAEGISNTILEAMASGLPVIASRVGGNPELVVDQSTGLLVPHSDALALARGMAVMLDDENLRRGYAAAAHARAHREFSIEVMVERYTKLYLAAANR